MPSDWRTAVFSFCMSVYGYPFSEAGELRLTSAGNVPEWLPIRERNGNLVGGPWRVLPRSAHR